MSIKKAVLTLVFMMLLLVLALTSVYLDKKKKQQAMQKVNVPKEQVAPTQIENQEDVRRKMLESLRDMSKEQGDSGVFENDSPEVEVQRQKMLESLRDMSKEQPSENTAEIEAKRRKMLESLRDMSKENTAPTPN